MLDGDKCSESRSGRSNPEEKHSLPIEQEYLWAQGWDADWACTVWLRLCKLGSGKGQVAKCLKHGNETSVFIKFWEIFDYFRKRKLFKQTALYDVSEFWLKKLLLLQVSNN